MAQAQSELVKKVIFFRNYMHEINIEVRMYKLGDAKSLVDIFFNTIHKVNIKDYTTEQISAWAPESVLNVARWEEKWKKLKPFVATINNQIVGFADFEDNGHIDCFYVHHEFQRCGVGGTLMDVINKKAKEKNINKIFAEVSITAKPFFESQRFIVLNEQVVEKRGVKLKNYKMEKLAMSQFKNFSEGNNE